MKKLPKPNYIDDFKAYAQFWKKGNIPNISYSLCEDSVVIDFLVEKERCSNVIVITGFKQAPMPLAKCGALVTHYSDYYLNHVGCGPAKVFLVIDQDSYRNAIQYIAACLRYPVALAFYDQNPPENSDAYLAKSSSL